jgi:hypothetical protein
VQLVNEATQRSDDEPTLNHRSHVCADCAHAAAEKPERSAQTARGQGTVIAGRQEWVQQTTI